MVYVCYCRRSSIDGNEGRKRHYSSILPDELFLGHIRRREEGD